MMMMVTTTINSGGIVCRGVKTLSSHHQRTTTTNSVARVARGGHRWVEHTALKEYQYGEMHMNWNDKND